MKKLLDRLLPRYARLPLLLIVVLNFSAYYLPRLFFSESTRWWDCALPQDDGLPLVPFFILFYVLAYFQWIGSYFYHFRDSKQLCYRIAAADLIAKTLCLILFFLLPTQIQRPEVAGEGIFPWATRLIYSLDQPNNLFPSIHCLESWLCFRGAMMLQKKKGWYIAGQGVLAVLVCASTVLIKQHYLLDIFAGIAAIELGLFLAGRCKAWRIFEKIQKNY